MKIIQTQKEFDILASQQCEINNGNSSDECTENWKAGYLYALQQLYNFKEFEKFKNCSDYMNKTNKKIDEYIYLEIVSL